MGKTRIHIQKGKFNNGLLDVIPIKLNNQFDRHNFERGYFRHERNKLIDKIADNELKTHITNEI